MNTLYNNCMFIYNSNIQFVIDVTQTVFGWFDLGELCVKRTYIYKNHSIIENSE